MFSSKLFGKGLDFPHRTFPSKPGSHSESQDSPIVIATQQISLLKRESGDKSRTSHDARAASLLPPRLLFPPVRNVETSILKIPKKVGLWVSRASMRP